MNTYAKLKAQLKAYYNAQKVANPNWKPTVDTFTGLLEKISKQWHLIHNFKDKLTELDGPDMPFGAATEEWESDLGNVEDKDIQGTNALKPRYPSYYLASYSSRQAGKKFVRTRSYTELQPAMLDGNAFAEFIVDIVKKLTDSYTLWKYGAKRALLGQIATDAIAAMGTTTTYSATTAYNAGQYVKSGTDIYVITKPKDTTNKAIDALVKEGGAVKLDLVTTLAIPTNTETGEAFIKQIKTDGEAAADVSTGHSFNGNTVGASTDTGLRLYIKQGVMPSLDVDTLAGALNQDRLAMPAEIKVLPDFGETVDSKVFAILIDTRAARRFNNYDIALDELNADGAFRNYYRHVQDTFAYSRNAFIKVYKAA